MVAIDQMIRDLLNVRKRRILLFAEAALPLTQFSAFRKLLLGELGEKGLEQDLVQVVAEIRQVEGHGVGGKIHARKEVPHG